MGKTTTTTPKQPKTVALGIYLRDMALAVLITAALAGVASYFFTINLHSQARADVVTDMQVVSKEQR